ncbi:MAG: DUF1292 domain-containing protein [Lachnospiraceae bacterium]|nr:DUF1292 domain-containing protein [Lachnospiraceae bacterium]
MKFHDKELNKLEVTLNLADGSELVCSVTDSFELNGKKYFALQALNPDKAPDLSQGPMLYRVEEDAEKNPVVVYIEDDLEFTAAANEYSRRLS